MAAQTITVTRLTLTINTKNMRHKTKLNIITVSGIIAIASLASTVIFVALGVDEWVSAYIFLLSSAIGIFTTCTL